MGAKLICRTGALAGNDFAIGASATLGRHSDNEVVVPSKVIFERHARIEFDEESGSYYLESLERKGRTRLDGVQVKKRTRLTQLHVVTLSDQFDFIFCVTAGSIPSSGTAGKEPAASGTVVAKPQRISVPQFGRSTTTEPAESQTLLQKLKKIAVPEFLSSSRKPSEEPRSGTQAHRPARIEVPSFQQDEKEAVPMPVEPSQDPTASKADQTGGVILVLDLPDGRHSFALEEGEHVVGRAQECTVCLDDPSLSRRHSQITVKAGKVWVRDLESVNHTFVDDSKVSEETEVRAGSTIRFGRVAARWTVAEE